MSKAFSDPTQQHRDEAHALCLMCQRLEAERKAHVRHGVDAGHAKHTEECTAIARALSHRDNASEAARARLLAEGEAKGRRELLMVLKACPTCEGTSPEPGLVGGHYMCFNEWHAIHAALASLTTLPPVGTGRGDAYAAGLRRAAEIAGGDTAPRHWEPGDKHAAALTSLRIADAIRAELPTDAPTQEEKP